MNMAKTLKKMCGWVLYLILFSALSLGIIYPMLQGLVLLPLDLLVSNYAPWHWASTILLKNPFMQDSIIQLFPWRHMAFTSLTGGIIPFWNPYQFGGMPFMAGMKSMVFYPFNLLFVLGEIPSWHLLLGSQLFFGFLGMFLLVKNLTRKILPSVFAAVSWAGNSFMIGMLEFGSDGHVLIWFPFFLYFAKQYIDQKRRTSLLFLGIAIVFSILAGQLQYFGYGLLLLGGFIIAYGISRHENWKTYLMLFLSVALGIGITGVQLFPSLELFHWSYRGIADSYSIFADELLKVPELLRLVAPDFFGHPATRDLTTGYIEHSGYFGIIPLFFSIFASVFLFRKNMLVRFFAVAGILGILLSLNGIAQIVYILKIPLITSGFGGRIFCIALLAGSILSGFGLGEFEQYLGRKKTWVFIAGYVFSLFVIYVGSIVLPKMVNIHTTGFTGVKFPLIILLGFAGLFALYTIARRHGKIPGYTLLVLGFIALTYFDMFRLAYRFLTFSNEKFLYPQTGVVTYLQKETQPYMDRAYGLLESELPTYFRIPSIETYHPLYPLRSARLLEALQGKDGTSFPVNKYTLAKSPQLKHVLDIMGVKYIVSQKDRNPALDYFLSGEFERSLDKVYSDDYFTVYQNKDALPRFGVYFQARQNLSGQDILSFLKNRSVDLKNEILLEESVPIELVSGTGSARLLSQSVNEQRFSVVSSVPALFFISDTFFPGWRVRVNNAESHIYRADYNFRAVVVPAGTSDVVFDYVPTHMNLYTALSIFSFIGLCFAAVYKPKA